MKKALAMALGAVLVAGSAAPASAASQIDFKGYYGVHYAVNGNLGYTGGDDANLNESFFENRLEVNVTFQATDEVSVVWRFRAPAAVRWGSGTGNTTPAGNRAMSSHYYYGQVVQDWGTVRVGRLSNGLSNRFGLTSLGWAPTLDDEFTSIAPFDAAVEADSIQYANKWDNGFSLATTYSKVKDGYFDEAWSESIGSDHDSDRFQIQGAYQWETGGASLNVMYQRDATVNAGAKSLFDEEDNLVITRPADGRADKTTTWFINPAFVQSWGAFSVHAEAMFATGTAEVRGEGVGNEDVDLSGEGFYLDFDYNYGPGRVNLAGWWVSGNDLDDTDDNTQANITQGFFYPLVVAYGPRNGDAYYAGPSYHANRGDGAIAVANGADFLANDNTILNRTNNAGLTSMYGIDDGLASVDENDDPLGDGFDGLNPAASLLAPGLIDGGSIIKMDTNVYGNERNNLGDNGYVNHWALMISGQHAFTDEITFNYALAYMALNNPNYKVLNGLDYNGNQIKNVGYHTQDKELGWEIDLGVNVQLLDNLAFTSTVGYMFTGDAYQQLKGYRVSGPSATDFKVRAEWEDADDAYSWMNSLTFSF